MFAFMTVHPNRISWRIEDGRTGSDPNWAPSSPVTSSAKSRLRDLGATEIQVRVEDGT